MTLKQLRSYIKEKLKASGVEPPIDEIIDLEINIAKNDLSREVNGFPGYAYGTTTAGIERYKLPVQLISLKRVEFNGEQINRVYTDAIKTFNIPSSGSITWQISNDTGVSS